MKNNPENGNGPVYLMRVGNSIQFEGVNNKDGLVMIINWII